MDNDQTTAPVEGEVEETTEEEVATEEEATTDAE